MCWPAITSVLYKMVCDGETDRVVGLHMIGPDYPEILQAAAAVAVKAGLTKSAFDDTVALRPTMAEELVLIKVRKWAPCVGNT